MNQECPFCKQDVLNQAFAEENGCIALYNYAPIVEGHSLVIPTKHITSLLAMSEEEYSNILFFARKVTAFLTEYYETPEFDLTIQQGENAGQSVAHLHIHIIPRKYNDLPEGVEWYEKMREQETKGLSSESGSLHKEHKNPGLDSDRKLSPEKLNKTAKDLKKAWDSWVSNQ